MKQVQLIFKCGHRAQLRVPRNWNDERIEEEFGVGKTISLPNGSLDIQYVIEEMEVVY
jgi:hypothetical protein